MRPIGKALAVLVVAALSVFAVMTPATAQETETGTVDASVFHCLALETAGPLTEVGDDCVPGPASFDFYLIGDGSGAPEATLAIGDDGVGAIDLQVGEYEVYETTTDTRLDNIVVEAEGSVSILFGIPRTEDVPDETGVVEVTTYLCEGVVGDPVALGEIGDDCVQISANLTFFFWGDGSDTSWPLTTSATEAVSIELPVGGYDVVEEASQLTLGTQVPAGTSALAIGYPAGDTPPPAETGTVTASVWHCLALETPGPLPEVGDDCVPGAAEFDFYLVGDGTDDSARLSVGEDGVNSITLPVGEYEVYEITTDTRLDNIVVTADSTSEISFGIPRVEDPPTETGILSVSTYVCEGLTESVVLTEIGDDCVRVATDLSFYLWGDGTDTSWPLTTSDTAAVDVELPVGDYDVIDEPTQWTFSATVVAEGSSIAFGIPAAPAPVDPTPVPDDPDPTAPPVSGLPETGAGSGSNIGALGALIGGAVLTAGALGVRIRKS